MIDLNSLQEGSKEPPAVPVTACRSGGNDTKTSAKSEASTAMTGGSVDTFYRAIERAVEKMKLGCSHLCFVRGRPGIGKSFQIERCLKQFGMQYMEVNGNVSEAYLYRVLHEHNGKTIWFKDVVRLLKGLRSIDLLKSACETSHRRLVTNLSYSDKQDDLPKQFNFTGSIIFDFNSLVGLKFREDFEALASRGDFVDLMFSNEQICQIMRSICTNAAECEVTEFLVQHYRFCGHNALNLRTQHRAFQTWKYACRKQTDWREELRRELSNQRSRVGRLLYQVLGTGPGRCTEVKRYLVQTGAVSTMRTADRRIADWIELGEIRRVSAEHRDFLVALPSWCQQGLGDASGSGDTSDRGFCAEK